MPHRFANALALLIFAALPATATGAARACPFCNVVQPTLSQRREAARIVALGEVREAGDQRARFHLHLVSKGAEALADRDALSLDPETSVRPGDLFVLLGSGAADAALESLDWECVAVNETSYAYFARAPSLRQPPAKRLPYFARYLEHPDDLIAEDAYAEFGLAPYDAVARVAELLPRESLREWIEDPGIPPHRKGFYALALGLPRTGEDERKTDARFLRRLAEQPDGDFREGFDGILGGWLLAAGPDALDWIESRILADPASADGDVRHATSALRFYFTYGDGIPKSRLREAMRHLLDRPEFAAPAVIDLARWKDWEVFDRVAGLYDRSGLPQPMTNRAVVAYLDGCPDESAETALDALRQRDPRGVAEALAYWAAVGGRQ